MSAISGSASFGSIDETPVPAGVRSEMHAWVLSRAAHPLLRRDTEARVKTIFVLDDDPDQAELMAQAVGARGRRVRAFSDPIRALAALSTEGADLLIADLSMP